MIKITVDRNEGIVKLKEPETPEEIILISDTEIKETDSKEIMKEKIEKELKKEVKLILIEKGERK